jgi:hypothetical protein
MGRGNKEMVFMPFEKYTSGTVCVLTSDLMFVGENNNEGKRF